MVTEGSPRRPSNRWGVSCSAASVPRVRGGSRRTCSDTESRAGNCSRGHDALPYRTPYSGYHACIESTGRWWKDPRSRQSDRFWQSRPCGSRHDAVSYRGGAIVAARRTVASGCLRADQRRITSGWESSAAPSVVTAPLIRGGLSSRRRLWYGTHGAVAVRACPLVDIRQPECYEVAAA